MKTCRKNPNLAKTGQKYWGTLREDLITFYYCPRFAVIAFMCSTHCLILLTSDMWLNNTERTFFLRYHCDSHVINTLPTLVCW
jgi:hypothetical protein